MLWTLLIALMVRLAAAGWSIVLLRRLHDWRLALLTLALLLMSAPLAIALLDPDGLLQQSIGVHALIVSVLMLLAVASIGWILAERTRLIQDLCSSEARYRALAESAQDAIFVISREDCVLYVNNAAARQLGSSPAAIIGRARAELFPPEIAVSQGISLRNVFDSRKAQTVESRVIFPNGERWISTALVPLMGDNGTVTAVLGVSRDMTERKRTEQEVQASRQRLATLSRQLISAQETERRRLAHELHDEIGQVLTAVHLSLQQVRNECNPTLALRLDESDRIVQQAVAQVRDMSLNLRPAMLDDFGLPAALSWFLKRQERGDGLEFHFRCAAAALNLTTELKNSCFRIVQEAVTNVQRHAKASNLWVELEETEKEMRLCIRDDGVGFDSKRAESRAVDGVSFGILGMRERVELHDGEFHVESTPNQGTVIRVRLPIKREPPAESSEDTAIDHFPNTSLDLR